MEDYFEEPLPPKLSAKVIKKEPLFDISGNFNDFQCLETKNCQHNHIHTDRNQQTFSLSTLSTMLQSSVSAQRVFSLTLLNKIMYRNNEKYKNLMISLNIHIQLFSLLYSQSYSCVALALECLDRLKLRDSLSDSDKANIAQTYLTEDKLERLAVSLTAPQNALLTALYQSLK